MAANWNVVGQVGTVSKNGNVYVVNIADNQYKNGKKIKTVWFNCICKFEPRVKKGDNVIANGFFEESSNKAFQYAMIVSHIGVIADKTKEGELSNDICTICGCTVANCKYNKQEERSSSD